MTSQETNDRIMNVIFRALRAINELLPAEGQIRLDLNERLIGPGGKLDSLGYINLVTMVEQEFESEFKHFVSLAARGGGDDFEEPLKTVETLAFYLETLYREILEKAGRLAADSTRQKERE